MKHCSRLLILLLVLSALAACGDAADDNNDFSNVSNGNNGGDPDTGFADVDAGSDVGEDDAGGDAGPDTDVDAPVVDEGSSCARPTDLGSLAAGQEHRFNSTLVAPADALDSSCDLASVESGVRVFSLQVEVASQVGLWTSVSPSRLDLRRGGCADADDVLTCTSRGSHTDDLQPGETYHLVVWGDVNQGDFELRINVNEALCNPADANWCDAGELKECRNSATIDSYSCADDCADGTACSGDACSSAIPVDLASTTSASFTGRLEAYTNTWSADQKTDCGFGGGAGLDSPYGEVVFEVSGVTAGQQLDVASLGAGDFAFFVLDGCATDTCLAAVDSDASGDQRMSFTVPADGSYSVVIEPLTGAQLDFEFQFDVQ